MTLSSPPEFQILPDSAPDHVSRPDWAESPDGPDHSVPPEEEELHHWEGESRLPDGICAAGPGLQVLLETKRDQAGPEDNDSGPSLSRQAVSNTQGLLSSCAGMFSSRKDNIDIMPNVLYNIGNTPMVRINKISKSAGLQCELCEYRPVCMRPPSPPP